MNKTLLILNDKETLKELSKDPDVEIRIKNQILDSINKRVVKSMEGEIEKFIRAYVSDALYGYSKDGEWKEGFLEQTFRLSGAHIGKTLQDIVKGDVHNIVDAEIRRQMYDVRSSIQTTIENRIQELLSEFTKEELDKIVKGAALAYVQAKLRS